jgi:hypothetical protein
MSLTVTIDAMLASGCSAEQMAAVVRAHEAVEAQKLAEKVAHRRALDAERQRRHRMSRTVTRDDRDIPPDKERSPTPPKEINPLSSLRSVNNSAQAREAFDRFWSIYPRRQNKKPAFTRWQTAVKKGINPEEIIEGAERYAEMVRAKGTEPQFIKNPDAWLNAGKWEDELPGVGENGSKYDWSKELAELRRMDQERTRDEENQRTH